MWDKCTISNSMAIFITMEYTIKSYRFAEEIIEHANHRSGLDAIKRVITECPLYLYPNKSRTNRRLDVVQQLLNTYFDQRFVGELGWTYHPDATNIADSALKADFRTQFNGLRVQTEVQFGNMARWYSDIFKFQTAYSQDLIDMGLCIVPKSSLALRIDSNITNFERCIRELPSAKLSITLPILMIGLEVGASTPQHDVSHYPISRRMSDIIGKGRTENRYRLVYGIMNNTPLEELTDQSPTGQMAAIAGEPIDDNEDVDLET